jgi:hypothetical protein
VQVEEKHGRDLLKQVELFLPAHKQRTEEIVVHLQAGALVPKSA